MMDKIKALFKRKPKVVEEKPPEATDLKRRVVEPKRKREERG